MLLPGGSSVCLINRGVDGLTWLRLSHADSGCLDHAAHFYLAHRVGLERGPVGACSRVPFQARVRLKERVHIEAAAAAAGAEPFLGEEVGTEVAGGRAFAEPGHLVLLEVKLLAVVVLPVFDESGLPLLAARVLEDGRPLLLQLIRQNGFKNHPVVTAPPGDEAAALLRRIPAVAAKVAPADVR